MASLTSTPSETREGVSVLFFTVGNVLDFEFSAGTAETSLQLQVTDTSGTAQVTLKNLPFDSAGELVINLAPILQTLIATGNDDNTDNSRLQTGFTGVGKSYRFKLKYRANGTGAYSVIGSEYSAVNGARQIGSTFGATLADYLPLISGSPPAVDFTGKWLTLFTNPVLFWYSDVATPASASDVSVWYSQLAFPLTVADFTVIDHLRARWYAGGSLIATDNNDDAGTSSNVITASVPNAETYVWQANEVIVDAGLGTGSPATMGTVAVDPITFEVRRACNNPVAIKWLNSLGAWECWVFEGQAPRAQDVQSDSGQYGIEVRNVKTATETRRYFSKTAQDELTLTAEHLKLDQVKALEEIATSPNVLIYVGALTAGTAFDDWQGVTVDTGSFSTYDTYFKRYTFEVTVRLVDKYFMRN